MSPSEIDRITEVVAEVLLPVILDMLASPDEG